MTGPSSPKRQASPSARGAVTLGLAAIAVLIFGFGLWAAFSSISGAVVASGQVEVEQNRQIVQHPDGGVIAEILVKDGDLVEAGDLLLRLDGTLLRSIPVPLPYPSCPAFGGPNLDTLYLTSIANSGHRLVADHPDAGRITAIRGLDVPGIAEGIYR